MRIKKEQSINDYFKRFALNKIRNNGKTKI
jgi:hypothetical protein